MACKDSIQRLNFELEAYRMKLFELTEVMGKDQDDAEVRKYSIKLDKLIDEYMRRTAM